MNIGRLFLLNKCSCKDQLTSSLWECGCCVFLADAKTGKHALTADTDHLRFCPACITGIISLTSSSSSMHISSSSSSVTSFMMTDLSLRFFVSFARCQSADQFSSRARQESCVFIRDSVKLFLLGAWLQLTVIVMVSATVEMHCLHHKSLSH